MQSFLCKRQSTNTIMAYNKNLLATYLTVITFAFTSGALTIDNFNIENYIQSNKISDVLASENLTIQNYIYTHRGRSLSYEFYDFIQNSKKSELSEGQVSIQDLKCLAELGALGTGISEGNLWALRVIDAWGSIPAGILVGRLYEYGNYDECIRIDKQISDGLQVQGKYCVASLPIFKMLNVEALSSYYLKIATCVPASCKAEQLNTIFAKFLQEVLNVDLDANTNIMSDRLCRVKPNEPLSGAAITFIVLLSVLGALVVLTTLCDYFACKEPLHPFIKAFSARVNARQLFRISDNSKNPNVISCLNGIRCMSLIWVVFAHTVLGVISKPSTYPYDMAHWFTTPFSMLISQGFFSVDSFFFLSGLLLVMVVMREMDKTSGKLNVPLMYLHRYLRLTPVLVFGILFILSLKYFSDGPTWQLISSRTKGCEEKWWSTLLYVQNYVNVKNMCLDQSWYLAVDMQLYIISPIILISLWKWGKKAIAGVIAFLILMWACLFSMIMIKDYSIFFKSDNLGVGMNHIYYPTHVRISPWLIGIIFGYYLYKTKGQKIKMSKGVVVLGWIASLGLICALLFSLLSKAQTGATAVTTLEEALFISLTRIAWPLALCWLVFACIHGYGGPIDSFLSTPLWQPLARLSYCIYIFHIGIIVIEFGRMRTNIFFSSFEMMVKFWPIFGFTVILSVFMYLLVEAPFTGLEKMLFSMKKPMKKQNTEKIATTNGQEKKEQIANGPEL